MKPNYINFGLSSPMGSELRKLVEKQLIDDLFFYGVDSKTLYFDWSESCIEGHLSNYKNSSLENYSGITVFDSFDNIVAEGWMDYVNEAEYNINGNFFIAFWDSVSIWSKDQLIFEKREFGVPKHVIEKIPKDIQKHYC